MSNVRTIRVTGKGHIRLKPDMTRITLTLEGVDPDYSETLRRSSESTEQVRDLLMPFGFKRSDLKTLNFSVDMEYEGYSEKDVYKQRFIGYRYRHQMKVEFDSDNDRLGRILYALAHCPAKPEFRLSYTVKDPEAAKNELLGKAVADAREKALVLTRAAGVELKDIQSMDYSWGEIDFEVRPMNRALMEEGCLSSSSDAANESYDLDIEPDDMKASDTVTVIWEMG